MYVYIYIYIYTYLTIININIIIIMIIIISVIIIIIIIIITITIIVGRLPLLHDSKTASKTRLSIYDSISNNYIGISGIWLPYSLIIVFVLNVVGRLPPPH